MMATIIDIYIEQGSDFTKSINLSGDYTGYTIEGTLEDSIGVQTTGFVAWTDDSLGELDIDFTNIETTAMASGIGKYNIEATLSGVKERVVQGRAYIDGDV